MGPDRHESNTGLILSRMNNYRKLSLVLGEFGEYSHDLYQLIKFLARKKAQHLSFINPAYFSETEAYSACLWDFRKRLLSSHHQWTITDPRLSHPTFHYAD